SRVASWKTSMVPTVSASSPSLVHWMSASSMSAPLLTAYSYATFVDSGMVAVDAPRCPITSGGVVAACAVTAWRSPMRLRITTSQNSVTMMIAFLMPRGALSGSGMIVLQVAQEFPVSRNGQEYRYGLAIEVRSNASAEHKQVFNLLPGESVVEFCPCWGQGMAVAHAVLICALVFTPRAFTGNGRHCVPF